MPRIKKRTKKTKPIVAKARKTLVRKTTTRIAKQESKPWFWMQSYTSLLLGVIVVIIGILFVATFFKTRHTQETSSTSTVATQTPTPTQTQEQTYTVQPGDDLWHISEKFYKTGYNYIAIIKANNLENPSVINAGNKLIIPQITPTRESSFSDENTELQSSPADSTTATDAIKTDTYIVQKGDDLWGIAVRAYGDGYKWTDIAKANNMSNPGLIFSGNVLQIPR